MSAAYKTRLEVQAILRGCLLSGLSDLGLTGWDVMEFANASFEKADKILLMNYIGSTAVGWNMESYPVESSALKRKVETIDQQKWQISAVLKRNDDTTDDSILAEDVANQLVVWFNSFGIEYLRNNGCASLRIGREDVMVYDDNSSVYQKRAVFTVKIQVPKTLTSSQIEMEAIKPDIYPV